jgi:hypothetical protein
MFDLNNDDTMPITQLTRVTEDQILAKALSDQSPARATRMLGQIYA